MLGKLENFIEEGGAQHMSMARRQTEITKKLIEEMGGEMIVLDPKNEGYFNPLDTVLGGCEELSKEEVMAKLKALYSIHSKFADENFGQKLSFEELREICKKNNFVISDKELLEIINSI